MDRSLFKRKDIDWDTWMNDSRSSAPAPTPQPARPQVAPVRPVARGHASSLPTSYSRPAPVPAPQAPVVQPAPTQPIVQPQQSIELAPSAVPHSWREAMRGAPVAAQPSMPVRSSEASTPIAPAQRPVSVNHAVAPAASRYAQPQPVLQQQSSVQVRHSVGAVHHAAPVVAPSQPIVSPSQQSAGSVPVAVVPQVRSQSVALVQPQPVAQSAQSVVRLKPVTTTAPSSGQITPQQHMANQIAAKKAQQVAAWRRQQAARRAEQQAQAVAEQEDTQLLTPTDRPVSSVGRFRLPLRLPFHVPHVTFHNRFLRYAVWSGAVAGAFVISFGVAVLPAYMHGDLHPSEANADNSTQTAQQNDPKASNSSTGTSVALGTSDGSAISLGAVTSSSDSNGRPAGYNQTKVVYKNVPLDVQRQNLPTSYAGNPEGVMQVAKDLGATTPIQTGSRWGTAYMLESSGVQVVVFADKQYLVIANAQGSLSATDWQEYISSYQAI